MKRFKITTWDCVIFGALVALVWGKSAQTILLAAIAFLLYLLVRSQLSKSTTSLGSVSDDNEFVVENDELSSSRVDLDSDINFQPRKNHFRFDSRFDTASRDLECEYKIEGTNVFVRLLHESFEDIGVAKTWEVRDGVLLETELRERLKNRKTVLTQSDEEEIAERKKSLEWHEILPSYWNGLKYFILLKKLPKDDARRFFRQEIERLKLGSNRFIEEASKIGFILDEKSNWRLVLPDGIDPPEEERRKLFDSITTFGISYDEFTMAPALIATLEKYVA
jgi:hypothetical protein